MQARQARQGTVYHRRHMQAGIDMLLHRGRWPGTFTCMHAYAALLKCAFCQSRSTDKGVMPKL